jgi:hypothetical protein
MLEVFSLIHLFCKIDIHRQCINDALIFDVLHSVGNRSSPRPISTGQLNSLLSLHIRPIYLVVYQGSYLVNPEGNLI